jgi:hypothetical protein
MRLGADLIFAVYSPELSVITTAASFLPLKNYKSNGLDRHRRDGSTVVQTFVDRDDLTVAVDRKRGIDEGTGENKTR